MVRQRGNCQNINCQSTHQISTIFWFQQQTATYMKTYFSVYGKQRGFFSGKICVILLPQACVCVCVWARMHVSVCRILMFNLLESHSNSLTHKLQIFFQDSLLSISRAPSSSGANHGSKPTLPIESSDIIWNIWHWCSQLKILCQKPTDWIFKTWRNTRELKELHAFSSEKETEMLPMMTKQLIIMWIIYSDDPHSDQIQNGPYVQNLITNCDHKVWPKSGKLRGQCNGALPTVWKQEASNATRLNLTNLTKKKSCCCWKLSFYLRDSLEIKFYTLAVGWKTKHFLLKKWFSVITALGNSTSYCLSDWQSPKGVQFFW